MEAFNAGRLFGCILGLSNLAHRVAGVYRLGDPAAQPVRFRVALRNYEIMKEQIDFICAELERLDLPVSLVGAKELRAIIWDETEPFDREDAPGMGRSVSFPPLVASRYWNYIRDLSTQVEIELSAKTVMVLPYGKACYFDGSKNIFPEAARNSSAEPDMDEAEKCFAVGRYTACVFHLMRVMELYLQAWARKVDIPLERTYDKQWQQVINDIRGRLKKLYPKEKDPNRVKEEGRLGHLETVKIRWRNPTMHPKATYTEEEAEKIIGAVQAFIEDFSRSQ